MWVSRTPTADTEVKTMSHIGNDKWLEAAQEHFDSAVEAGNLGLAKDIIADTLDAGFADVARSMTAQLREVPPQQWNVKSFIQPQDL